MQVILRIARLNNENCPDFIGNIENLLIVNILSIKSGQFNTQLENMRLGFWPGSYPAILQPANFYSKARKQKSSIISKLVGIKQESTPV